MNKMDERAVKGPETQASEAVVDAVATAESVDPLDLSTRLQDVVDGDALDRLTDGSAASPQGDVVVSFEMCDHDVRVHGDGRLYVDAVLVENFHA